MDNISQQFDIDKNNINNNKILDNVIDEKVML